MGKDWSIIHFTEENTVEAVPSTWYENQKCFWPPKALRRYVKDLIKKRELPDDDWDCFPAKLFGQYDTFEVAKYKANKAQDTTDLSSGSETISLSKRIPKKTKFSSDEDSESENDIVYPKTPKKKTKFDISVKSTTIDPLALDITSPSISVGSSCSTITPINQWKNDAQNMDNENKEFQRQVLNKLNYLSAKLSEQSELLEILLRRRDPLPDSNSINTDYSETIFHLFPLKENEDLNKIEEFLKLKDNFLALVKELSRIGGDTAKELVKRIMYRIFSNELGQLYSWDGAKGKKPFKTLSIAEVILKAVQSNPRTEATDNDEIIKVVKQWLVRSKDRHNNSLKKISQADISLNETG